MNNEICGQFADQRSDDESKYPVELQKTDADHRFQDLIEDCLLAIFSASSIDLMDLCSLASTCKRFRSIAQCVIGKKFCFNALYFASYESNGFASQKSYIFQSVNLTYETRKRSEVKKIFRNFGICLTKIFVGHELFTIRLVQKYCNEDLKSLKLEAVTIPASLAVELRPVFKRLETLTLWSVAIGGDKSIFRDLDSLIELNIMCIENFSIILENVFPKLERIMYRQFETITGSDDTSLEKILTFIRHNTTMKSIDLQLICDENCWMLILEAIGNSCMGLQKLGVISSSSNYSCSSESFKSLNALKSLRAVKLLGVSFVEDIGQLAFLAQLKELFLKDCVLSRDGLAIIIRQAVNLVKLESNFVLDERIFTRIVDIVKFRHHMLTLECNSNFDDTRRTRSQMVRLNPI